MSDAAPSERAATIRGGRFVIVASRFNPTFVDGLIDHAVREFGERKVETIRVPGAFEIPLVVQEIARRGIADAILACAVILQGETAHAEHLGRSVTDALQRIALNHHAPVINCVLTMANETQARERCLEDRINRGTEAARAALEISGIMRDLRAEKT